jgi:hypothetical protein
MRIQISSRSGDRGYVDSQVEEVVARMDKMPSSRATSTMRTRSRAAGYQAAELGQMELRLDVKSRAVAEEAREMRSSDRQPEEL